MNVSFRQIQCMGNKPLNLGVNMAKFILSQPENRQGCRKNFGVFRLYLFNFVEIVFVEFVCHKFIYLLHPLPDQVRQ